MPKNQHLDRYKKNQLNRENALKRNISRLKEYTINSDIFRKIHIKVPERLNFVSSNFETTQFFSNILTNVKTMNRSSEKMIVDLLEVTEFNSEVIVYFISIIDLLSINNVNFAGNLPRLPELSTELGRYGIQNHAKVRKRLDLDLDRLCVFPGSKVDVKVAGRISDFVEKAYNLNPNKCKILYSTLIELMDNTNSHAYNKVETDLLFPENWYICVRNFDDHVAISFLDIGEGIPRTIKRRGLEHLSSKHSDLIESTLKDDFSRTKTGLAYRGYGLTETYKNYSVEKQFDELEIISGKGYCRFDDIDRTKAIKDELDEYVNGTIFKWKLYKKEIENGT